MGNATKPVVRCKECQAELDESASAPPSERKPCPKCGSLVRHVSIEVSDTVTVHGHLALKARTPGEKRPFMEQKVGDSYSYTRKRWMQLRRVIDRRSNRYYEKIDDPDMGELIREVDEPLTEHIKRGDARRARNSGNA